MNIIKTNITTLKNTIHKHLKLKKGNFLPDKSFGSMFNDPEIIALNQDKELESYILSALNKIKGLNIISVDQIAESNSFRICAEYYTQYFETEVNFNE